MDERTEEYSRYYLSLLEDQDYADEWKCSAIIASSTFKNGNDELFGADIVMVVNKICEELCLSSEIEFTWLDNISVFLEIQADCSNEFGNYSEVDLFLNLCGILMICIKSMDSEVPVNLFKLLEMAKKLYPTCTCELLKEYEFKVFEEIKFKIRQPEAYNAMLYYLFKIFLNNSQKKFFACEYGRLVLLLIYLERELLYEREFWGKTTNENLLITKHSFIGAVAAFTVLKLFESDSEQYCKAKSEFEATNIDYKSVEVCSNILLHTIQNESVEKMTT